AILKNIEDTFGHTCHPLNLPIKGCSEVIDCFANQQGQSDFGNVARAHEMLIDSVVESDEEMMEAYLNGDEIPADKLSNAFGQAMVEGTVIPMFFTSARDTVGIKELLDGIVKYFPSPAMFSGTPVTAGMAEDAKKIDVVCDAAKPFIGHAFKITSDPYVGKLAWIRVLQGTIKGDTQYHLRDEKKTAKVGHLFKAFGGETREIKSAVAGDIVALAKVEEIRFGDVLHEEAADMYRKTPAMPTPMFSLAVEPKSRNDEQKISEALHRFVDEDPTFATHRDSQTHETVICGIGDLHLRMMLMKMKNRFHIEVNTKPPKIPYKETITAPADGHHRHKKQTGGAGQFGEVYLRIEPLERGAGFEFVSELFGESIPRQFLPAIQKGVEDVIANGAIAGYPMQDIKVAITDGKHHPVDSKEIAFKTAGKHAFIDAVTKAKPVLLEPIVDMEISVPAANMGDIASDLATRRGRIQGQEIVPGNMAVVRAQAPLAEVMQYNSQLRSITGGQGSYSMELSHYEPVPANVQQQIVAAAVKRHDEDE
ncbi:MAG TPA: elongation factor G, partial [Phycisphaerae bacterium]|nr:elongation factor G [Phycisphaerae bacterium]